MPSQADRVNAYRAATTAQRSRVAAAAGSVWLDMTSWSDAAAEQMLAKVVPIVLGGQRATATTTQAFVQQLTGSVVRLDVDSVTGAALRNGLDPMDVYMRAVVEARAVYSRTQLVEFAVNAGFEQLWGSVVTDMQLAATHTSRQVMGASGVDTFRTVTRPGACPLCVAASDRVYYVGELQPIHRGCHCVSIPGSKVPKSLQGRGLGTNEAYVKGETPGGRKLVIDHSGEIGPVLDYADRVKGANRPRRGARVTAETITDAQRVDMKRAQLASYEKVLAGGGGTDWTRAKAVELRAELASVEQTQTSR